MIKFGIIGTNKITDRFIQAGNGVEGFSLSAVYSRSIDRAKYFAYKYNVKSYFDDIEKMANSNLVDAVYIASPNSCHASQAIQIMEAGKHVLCEKPIAANKQELMLMIETAKRNNVVLLEAMRNIFTPTYKKIKDAIKQLGEIRRISFQYSQYSSRYDNFKNGIIENAFKPELSNGALMDLGVYCIHPMVDIMGEPKDVKCILTRLSNSIDGSGDILFDYGSCIGRATFSKITDNINTSFIEGEEATMYIDHIADPTKIDIIYRNGNNESYKFNITNNNMAYEIEEFIRLIINNDVNNKYLSTSILEMSVIDKVKNSNI